MLEEMKTVAGIIENPHIYDGPEKIPELGKGETHTLLDWVPSEWRQAFPTLDLNSIRG